MASLEKKDYTEKIKGQLTIVPRFLYPRENDEINFEMVDEKGGKYTISCSFPSEFTERSLLSDKNFIEKCLADFQKNIKEHANTRRQNKMKEDFCP